MESAADVAEAPDRLTFARANPDIALSDRKILSRRASGAGLAALFVRQKKMVGADLLPRGPVAQRLHVRSCCALVDSASAGRAVVFLRDPVVVDRVRVIAGGSIAGAITGALRRTSARANAPAGLAILDGGLNARHRG